MTWEVVGKVGDEMVETARQEWDELLTAMAVSPAEDVAEALESFALLTPQEAIIEAVLGGE